MRDKNLLKKYVVTKDGEVVCRGNVYDITRAFPQFKTTGIYRSAITGTKYYGYYIDYDEEV